MPWVYRRILNDLETVARGGRAGLSREYGFVGRNMYASRFRWLEALPLLAVIGALAVHIVENPMLNGEVIRLDGAIRMAPR